KNHAAAASMAQELDELNLARRQEEERINAEAKAQASDILARVPRASLVRYCKDRHPGKDGIVASRIVEDYYRPTIIVCEDQGSLKGSGRSVREFDLHGGLTRTADCLLNFGGHRQAAGVRLALERLEEFRTRFDAAAEEVLGPNPLLPSLTLECELGFKQAGDHGFLKELELLQPFGPGNPEPVFQSPPLLVKERSFLGRSREHVLLRLTDSASGITLAAKAWRMAHVLPASLINKHILVAYTPRIDTYNGIASVDIAIKDWRPA
ncbi:MAG: DHHA1 domain-containing protein, partial [Halodesulfovibrio sp.]